MRLERIFKIFETFDKDKFSFVYRGAFSNPTLIETTDILHKDLSKKKMEKVKNKLSFLMVEAFQNVARYGQKHQEENDTLILRNINDIFFITTVNTITRQQKNYIEEKLKDINNLTPDELKKRYVEILTNKQFSEKGGAGLGFIEMIRKSKEKIQFHFKTIDDKHDSFYFQLKFRSNKDPEKNIHLPISQAVELHDFFEKQKIQFFYKGDFSHNFVSQIVGIISKGSGSYGQTTHTITRILAELIQNISLHSPAIKDEKNGMLTVSKDEEKFVICAGNFVTEGQKKQLEDHLNFLAEKNQHELDELYTQWLLEDKGLGLLAVYKSAENVFFDFLRSDQNYFFFVIKVEISLQWKTN